MSLPDLLHSTTCDERARSHAATSRCASGQQELAFTALDAFAVAQQGLPAPMHRWFAS
jgi:hypothetical protein